MKGMGKAIRRYREEAGITQERLAELVDISTNHLGAIEREVKTPTMETFVKLLNVLGAEPNEVLNGSDSSYQNGTYFCSGRKAGKAHTEEAGKRASDAGCDN